MSDLIDRQAAIDALDEQIAWCNKAIKSFVLSMKDEYAAKVEKASLTAFRERLEYLPPAQPEPHYDEWCDSCKEYDKEKHCCPRWNRVIRQTLADAQPEPCEDAVSRKAVQYLLAHFVDEDKYVDACDGLKHLPPVTPKQRTGKWIDGIIPNDGGGLPVIVCDQCNTFFPLQFGDGHNFCPNCGAKMMEGDAE